MKPSRAITAILSAAVVSCICGCSYLNMFTGKGAGTKTADAPSGMSAVRTQERNFAGALVFLKAGREREARELLERVVIGTPQPGVTDDALFRLSLFLLRDESAKGSDRALELLERLMAEYPDSIWTHQSAPLASYLTTVKTLRNRQRDLKLLKDQNLSLSRDNREMRQSIERLKSLDLELEYKIKR